MGIALDNSNAEVSIFFVAFSVFANDSRDSLETSENGWEKTLKLANLCFLIVYLPLLVACSEAVDSGDAVDGGGPGDNGESGDNSVDSPPSTVDLRFTGSLNDQLGAEMSASLIEAIQASDITPSAAEVANFVSVASPIADELFADADIVPWSDIPTGTAQYVGIATMIDSFDGTVNAEGVMTTEVNFQNEEITGTAGSFYRTSNGNLLEGSIALDANFDRNVDTSTMPGITGSLIGVLSDGSANTANFNLEAEANFYSDGSSVIIGKGEGGSTFTGDLDLGGGIEFSVFNVE